MSPLYKSVFSIPALPATRLQDYMVLRPLAALRFCKRLPFVADTPEGGRLMHASRTSEVLCLAPAVCPRGHHHMLQGVVPHCHSHSRVPLPGPRAAVDQIVGLPAG